MKYECYRWSEMPSEVVEWWRENQKKFSVFSYYEWKSAFVATYIDYSYYVLVEYDNGIVTMLLPLQMRNEQVEVLGTPRCDYAEIIGYDGKPESMAEIVESIHTHFPNTSISLKELSYKIDPSAIQRKRLSKAEDIMKIDFGKTFMNPWQSLEKYCNRKLRLLEKDSIAYTYKELSDKEEKKDHIKILVDLHRKKWDKTTTPSQFKDARNIDLYYSLIEHLSHENTILNILYFGENPVALHFGFKDIDSIYYYKPIYDTDYHKYSPGKLLLFFMICNCRENGYKYFDFLRGEEKYKLELMTDLFSNYNIIIDG